MDLNDWIIPGALIGIAVVSFASAIMDMESTIRNPRLPTPDFLMPHITGGGHLGGDIKTPSIGGGGGHGGGGGSHGGGHDDHGGGGHDDSHGGGHGGGGHDDDKKDKGKDDKHGGGHDDDHGGKPDDKHGDHGKDKDDKNHQKPDKTSPNQQKPPSKSEISQTNEVNIVKKPDKTLEIRKDGRTRVLQGREAIDYLRDHNVDMQEFYRNVPTNQVMELDRRGNITPAQRRARQKNIKKARAAKKRKGKSFF